MSVFRLDIHTNMPFHVVYNGCEIFTVRWHDITEYKCGRPSANAASIILWARGFASLDETMKFIDEMVEVKCASV